MKKISIIVPVHKIANQTDLNYFNEMKESLKNQTNKNFEVLYITPKNIEVSVENPSSFTYELGSDTTHAVHHYPHDDEMTYQRAVNYGASVCGTEYFTVLEFDDTFSQTFVEHIHKHLNHYGSKYDIYTNIVFEVNEQGSMMGLRNETAWVVNLMAVQGEIDLEKSKQFLNSLSLVGAVFKTSKFLSINGLKPSFEIFFNQEFLIRALENSFNVYVIPRIGVKHTNNRPGSYFDQCSAKFNNEDRKYWHSQILKQCYTNEDYKKPSL